MNKIIDLCKDKLNFPTVIIIIAVIVGLINFFSYKLPFTDNAFVVANNQTVAADISGYISDIYVKNGQRVKKGDPLFRVFDKPYKNAVAKSQANYDQSLAALEEQKQVIKKDLDLIKNAQDNLAEVEYEYKLKSNPKVKDSISDIELTQAFYLVSSNKTQLNTAKSQLAIDQKSLLQKEKQTEAAKSELDTDLVNLEETIVKAGSNGVIDNMFLSLGTPINARQALFSLVNTDEWFIQANMYETDLRKVRTGDKAVVILRMYYFDKVFHGEIINNLWVADRQTVNSRSQQQTVASNNEWLNLPQRVPVLIKITDPDANYPLNPGSSAYVYIQTK